MNDFLVDEKELTGFNKDGLDFDKQFADEQEEEVCMTYEELDNLNKLREKACLSCLLCCSRTLMPVSLKNKEELAFYETKGFRFFVLWDRVFTVIHGKCPHLTKLGCKIYKNRPAGCVNYDGRMDPLMTKVCKWWGIKEDPTNKTLKGKVPSLEDAPTKKVEDKDDLRP